MLSEAELNIERIAFVNNDVNARLFVEKALDVFICDTVREQRKRRVWIVLLDLPCRKHGLGSSYVVNARAQSVQIRKLELVEVGEPEMPVAALQRQCERCRVADRQPDDCNSRVEQTRLFLRCDLVAIAV